jgi:SAM-dependent methyltransferase
MTDKHQMQEFLESDEAFNGIFPGTMLNKLSIHLTPLKVAVIAAKFLAGETPNRILDIGSGPGKFCLIGALTTGAIFTGVERRKDLADLAKELIFKYRIARIHIIEENISAIDFQDFDAFYLFNPFYENLESEVRIDQQFKYSYKLYREYTAYVKEQLAEMPIGTKVAAFHGQTDEIPSSYRAGKNVSYPKLKLFIKKFSGG